MTTAAAGVQKALARAGSSVVTIAEMTAEDLIAQMTDEQKTALSAQIAPVASAADMPPKKKDGCSEDGDEDDAEEGTEMGGGKPKPKAEASADRVKAVAAAVANDAACNGKADLALSLLADDDYAGLSASALIKIVARTPANVAADAGIDREAAARAEMRAAIAETSNSNIEASAAPALNAATRAASVWDTAMANEFRGARN